MDKILILDLGGQANQQIARRVRECHVYCEIVPAGKSTLEFVRRFDPIGIIVSGGSGSISEGGAPALPQGLFDLGIPVLGIGWGCQLMAQELGGQLQRNSCPCAGNRTLTNLDREDLLFADLPAEECITWLCGGDHVVELPAGFRAW